jgi:hypothetical protein
MSITQPDAQYFALQEALAGQYSLEMELGNPTPSISPYKKHLQANTLSRWSWDVGEWASFTWPWMSGWTVRLH